MTGELGNKIDSLWEIFWNGGITNPLDVVEQKWVFPFIKNLHGDKNSAYSKYTDSICESKTQNLIQINDCPLRGVAYDLGVSVLLTGAYLYVGDVKNADHHEKANGRI